MQAEDFVTDLRVSMQAEDFVTDLRVSMQAEALCYRSEGKYAG